MDLLLIIQFCDGDLADLALQDLQFPHLQDLPLQDLHEPHLHDDLLTDLPLQYLHPLPPHEHLEASV